eukprot:1180450-Prorocentrum_minimum.AAC.3
MRVSLPYIATTEPRPDVWLEKCFGRASSMERKSPAYMHISNSRMRPYSIHVQSLNVQSGTGEQIAPGRRIKHREQ